MITKDVTIELWPPKASPGGQVVGPGSMGVKVCHPIGIEIAVNIHRSQFKNRQLAMEMMEYALSEV
jgi:protein subunit release factor A